MMIVTEGGTCAIVGDMIFGSTSGVRFFVPRDWLRAL